MVPEEIIQKIEEKSELLLENGKTEILKFQISMDCDPLLKGFAKHYLTG